MTLFTRIVQSFKFFFKFQRHLTDIKDNEEQKNNLLLLTKGFKNETTFHQYICSFGYKNLVSPDFFRLL